MGIYAKVRPAVDAAAAELWGRLLAEKLDELRTTRAEAASPPGGAAGPATARPAPTT